MDHQNPESGPEEFCEIGKQLLSEYLDAVEIQERIARTLEETFAAGDAATSASLLQEANQRVQSARERYTEHQSAHRCCEHIVFESGRFHTSGGGR